MRKLPLSDQEARGMGIGWVIASIIVAAIGLLDQSGNVLFTASVLFVAGLVLVYRTHRLRRAQSGAA